MDLHPRHRLLRGLCWLVGLAVALAALGMAAGQGDTGLVSTWLLVVAVSGAALACGLRARDTHEDRAAWVILAVGMACWAVAEAVYELVVVRMVPEPYPSVADALWLTQYPLVALALALMVRSRVGHIPPAFWVDAALGACAVAACAVTVLPAAMPVDTGAIVDVLYPAGDVLLLVLVAGALGLAGDAWSPVWTLLAGAFAAQVVADTAYLLAGDAYVPGGAADLGWPVAALLFALAAAHGARGRRRARSRWSMLWTVTVFGTAAVTVQVVDHFGEVPCGAVLLSAAALLLIIVRVVLLLQANADLLAEREAEARLDALTGLANRRALLEALESATRPQHLALYDLDGFKAYNDAFGHPAGDALLRRIAERLGAFAAAEGGQAYRLGGDEFCVLAPDDAHVQDVITGAAATMAETGEGFSIAASSGSTRVPHPGGPSGALSEADAAMYTAKRGGRRSAARQSGDVLEAAIRERHPDLAEHDSGVAQLAWSVAGRMGLNPLVAEQVREAARLHDVGKIAVPDTILDKPGPLDAEELAFIREHTLIGERIVSAAPDLVPVGRLVRSSHERWDGQGYPDGLAGEAIPLGARIVAACDAYDAMTSDRPYQAARTPQAALEELHRCAGSQFDPQVVAELRHLLERSEAPTTG